MLREEGTTERNFPMENNKQVQFNWGTFNVPTLATILTVLWYTATHSERQDSRIDALEINNSASQASIARTLEALQIKTQPLDNITYRVTVAEQNIVANHASVNARVDRQSESVQSLSADINKLSISFSVLSEKIDSALPTQKSDFMLQPAERQVPTGN